ncbi:hypothetical protein Ahy_A07g036562 isoform A [Arachis hypogaea]|uniref:Uncharacterized protein n=1 Tax=Arachis hypogaea TaxID=3818 RepID=A0A445CGG3_ARAHY|nr:hypothetical protein Ahy_A07g036562 isoform A [Arachis hypogaea]
MLRFIVVACDIKLLRIIGDVAALFSRLFVSSRLELLRLLQKWNEVVVVTATVVGREKGVFDALYNFWVSTIREWRSRKRDILVVRVLEDVCERHDHLTIWLCLDIKKALYVYWETDEGFRHFRLTNRANNALARSSKYTDR